jgi:hypothetical protein
VTRTLRLSATAAVFALLAAATPAHAIRVATWNVTLYQGANANARNASFRTVLAGLNPDVLLVQELNNASGRDSLLNNVLNVIQPGQWTASPWITLSGIEGGAIYWKPSKVDVTDIGSISVGGTRLVLRGVAKPVGYVSNASWCRLYSVHFKAGNPLSSPSDSASRRLECTNLRTYINNEDTSLWGPAFLIGGDTNFYGNWEGGYIRLTESQLDNDGRGRDPIPLPGTWNDPAFAQYHTQSACNSPNCPALWASAGGGGLDDRFDLWLSSSSLRDGQGLEFLPNSNVAYGNDGAHYNTDIDAGGFNSAVGVTIATALRLSSDHIPLLMQLQVPPKVVAASQLDFGSVIVGAAGITQPLSVSNPAVTPADKLRYSLVAPIGFTVSPGADSVAAGAAAKLHTVGLLTGTAGNKAGTLFMTTNDVDSTSKPVQLSARVLDHAVSSLDSGVVLTTADLDFGDHSAANFEDQPVRVHDRGWNALQAQLAITGASITGGDGRFSLVGFAPVTVGAVGHTFTVHFDGTGAPLDSAYEATLTFTTADEALPGATAATSLTVNLSAHVSSGAGVGDSYTLRLLPPRPNPARHGAELAFELPREAPVDAGVYDLGGRRVAVLAAGRMGSGPHTLRWNAQDEGGNRVPAGLYFVRFTTPGLTRTYRLALLP